MPVADLELGVQVDAAGSECPRAIVGHVEARILVAFPGSKPASAPVAGKIYNGRTRGAATDLLLELAGAAARRRSRSRPSAKATAG
jgi:hypothetical protein